MFETGLASEFQTDLSILLHLSRDTGIHIWNRITHFPIQFLGATILIAGSERVVWPWQAAWWPAGDSMNHWLWSSVPPPKKNAKIEPVAIVFHNEHPKKYLPSWELTYLLPKDVLVPQSLSVRSRSRRVRRMAPSIRRGKGYESSVLVI